MTGKTNNPKIVIGASYKHAFNSGKTTLKFIPLIPSLIHYYKIFQNQSPWRLRLLIVILFVGGLLEGLGIMTLIPIISELTINSETSELSNFMMKYLGFNLSIGHWMLVMVALFLLKGIITYIQFAWVIKIEAMTERDLKIEFLNYYKNIDYKYYTDQSSGKMSNIIITETQYYRQCLKMFCLVLVSIIYIFIYISGALIANLYASLIVILLSGVLLLLMRFISRMIRALSKKFTTNNEQIQGHTIQFLQNIKYLKATDSTLSYMKRLIKLSHEKYSLYTKMQKLNAITQSINEPIVILILIVIMYIYVVQLGVPISGIIVMLLFFSRAFKKVFTFLTYWQKFLGYTGSVDAVKNMREEITQHIETANAPQPPDFNQSFDFNRVTYMHHDDVGLKDVSISINHNQTVGIVGPSGAGKTTLFDLIVGLLKPQSGEIQIDGVSLNQGDIQSFRSQIGYVTQSPVIFDDTIENNITLWDEQTYKQETTKRITLAAQKARCSDFIDQTSDGYQTQLGEQGVKLSGGQAQRLSIARELYKQPQLLIMDEATSSLDSVSEKQIRESLRQMHGELTIIIITHRLSSVTDCDYIYVLEKGSIVESGSFKELVENRDSKFNIIFADQLTDTEL